MPEWTPWARVLSSTSNPTRPRRLVVSAGTPMSQLALSAMTMTSARSTSLCSDKKASSVGEPISSSPSTKTVTPTGSSAPWARSAARWAAMPALSSAAPRPKSRSPRSVGSNGSDSHSARSPVGCTSWWA